MVWRSYKKVGLFIIIIIALAIIPIASQGELLFTKVSNATDETEADAASLEEKLTDILTNEQLNGATAAVSVMHAKTGDILFSQNGGSRLHPASNMKILTAAAALETLGENYQFATEVRTDGKVKGKMLHGNLYLKGNGDPTLLKSDLRQMAKELKNQGILKVKGDLIADDTWYDDVRLSQDLNWSDEPFYTGAQVSALTLSPNDDYDAGTVIVEVLPQTTKKRKAVVQVTPETDYVEIVNHTQIVAADGTKDISIEREHGTNRIIVEGTMPEKAAKVRSWVSVWEPTGYVLNVFQQTLQEEGIAFIGKSKALFGKTPAKARMLTSKKSMPLKDLLIPFMKLSNNGHGEVLTKEMGKVVHGEGSWGKGIKVIEQVMDDLDADTDTMLLRDGSGMSHKNMIPSEELLQVLYQAQKQDWFPVFQNSLPVAGEPERLVGGTLRDRMKEKPAKGNVIAKTGSLTGVSTLSGYVTTQNQEPLIFSIIINNYIGSDEGIIKIEDQIATMLAAHQFK
ncbi:D-alanyl-D-alanine carboxypeptidase DacC [Virgibacillus pantothenticus]|uniref:D-alanyl-D-alanine carboxypeptidase n=1 Tax=Virgibacillus pantothenticus TaxID=1473 RepID=A0A0L0QSS9_VIRPA|nr:D-alanyl-D-alanine carboxypeptidase/D-alanyl-D-alanine-endopeptidase [Virgibacillus pantothenticus]KNE21223.1 D-alanyl-D-alanine carboxypeptidase [Virgibacillus pantothenticus]MBU8568658.1 D-alanyl-D-alanine carboxypeptidase/D-alanyl-D-alanine-endopeptidase [Virgibacillus pantothenticus]MBU8602673.1 D-alanyl-D-alanine carboxypeptidase/D-alanyl-D-alanine-endopeptidase [Virgibacillus pantothenticus]MBU8636789.1 D-alanyl-D-alanine carboxypeptidase/D-alanyl-D-alanine-endopeptidase [Virgibacillus